MTDLVFKAPPLVGPPTALVFGDLDATAVAVTLTLAGQLPGLNATIRLVPVAKLVIAAALPPMGASVAVLYLTQTERPLVNQVVGRAQVAQPVEQGAQSSQDDSTRTSTGFASPFTEAQPTGGSVNNPFTESARTQVAQVSLFQDGRHMDTAARPGFQEGSPDRREQITGVFQEGQRAQAPRLQGRFQDGLHDRRPQVTARWQGARGHLHSYQGRAGAGNPLRVGKAGRFQDGQRPPPGVYVGPVIVDPVLHLSADLLFECPPAALHLIFGAQACYLTPFEPATLFILPARFYMTTHNVFAQRLPDLADIPIYAATVSADAGSYCWTLQASGPASLFELLSPVDGLPVQLRLTLDGIPWVFAVDALSRSGSFGKTGVNVNGRSVTALIGAPYLRAATRTNTESRLAQQLALDALQYTGVDLDWGLVDWTVPTGAWSHSGTPLDAVQAIAQAAGGYLQSHRSAATLLARHPYSQRAGDQPGAPWGWMTGPADVELALDAIITDGTERRDGADLNAVYVSGTTQGVLAQVKRLGSAGDKLAAMVTDALITDAIAARQRGLAILGAAGKKYHVSLELPVLTGLDQPGVLDVGQLVQVNAAQPWRGRVRSVSVNANRPSIRQTVTLERHLETA